MTVMDFLSMTRRRPFVPFRVVTTDGTIYEVEHPDLVLVGVGSVIIGYPSPEEPHAYSRYDIVSLRHVIRLEPREEPAPAEPASGPG